MKHITMNIFNEYRALGAKIEKQYIESCCLAITWYDSHIIKQCTKILQHVFYILNITMTHTVFDIYLIYNSAYVLYRS